MRFSARFASSTREFEAQTQLASIHQGQNKNVRSYSLRFMALVEKMGAECPKQFLLNLYLHGLQKEIARHVAISQLVTLSSAIQWTEHVDVATRTYNDASPSNTGSSLGGGGNNGNRGGRGGRNFG